MHRTPHLTTDRVHAPAKADNSNDVSTLWITGRCLELQRKLVQINGLHPTIIRCPDMPCETDRIPKHTLDLVAAAIISRDVRCVVVCGQPYDVPLRSRINQCLPQETAGSYGRILQRIGARLERQQCAQERVRTQLDQIRSHTLALTSRAISLFGMFYIPESDAFLVYNRAEDQFVPIAEVQSW